MADSSAQSLRQLKIKTGVVKRLHKEQTVYQQEAEQQEKVIAKLQGDGADDADVRNAERVLKDTQQMIPRTQTQLEEARAALQDLVNALQSDDAISTSEEFTAASSILQQVEASRASNGN